MAKVLTEEELYDIECAIYNDDNQALYKALPQAIEDSNYGGSIKELAQGQEYLIIPESTVMLRRDGRLFNFKHIRPLKPLWTPNDLLAILYGKQVRFSELYKSKNWEFDSKELTKAYVKNNWGLSVTNLYTPLFNELYG